MQIYLPIAEMSVDAEVILLLGLAVGLLSGMFGVGGGFLTTPFLIFIGLPPAIAVGTQANQLVASSMSGALGHWKRGDVDIKMGSVMLIGSILGTFVGVMLFKILQSFGQIDVVISILYVVLLGIMGVAMMYESLGTVFKKKQSSEPKKQLHTHPVFEALPYKMRFPRSRLYISALIPAGIGFLRGLLVSTLGIGGGFLVVPAMIYVLGMPTLLVAGTSLYQIVLTSSIAAIMHAVANQTVDLVLAALLIVSSVIGAQIGVKIGKYVKGVSARVLLASILLVVAFQLAGQLFITPPELYSTVTERR